MSDSPELSVFFDGACPLCSREIRFLERRDQAQRIAFVDIAAAGFEAERYGLDIAALHRTIHGQLADGATIQGLEVFRSAYSAVGLGWLLAPTGWPGLAGLCERAYRVFARNRLRWTGRAAECDCAAASR